MKRTKLRFSRSMMVGISTIVLLLTTLVAVPANAAPVAVIVTGNFLDETTSCADWAPACTDTEMSNSTEKPTVYEKTLTVPSGSWKYKVKADENWYSNIGDDMQITVAAATEITFQFDTKTGRIGLKYDQLAAPYTPADDALIQTPVEKGTGESFYFVLTDRFYNGDTSNDTADLGANPMESGFDPTNKGFYHGGDIAGLRAKLDYIQDLGMTAIWLTPSFQNRPVQGSGENASAGYHGYWITDFTQIDPHLGTNDELKLLIDEAHGRGIKVYFDIIVNHTADLIQFKDLGENGDVAYRSVAEFPYKDAQGNPFNITEYAGSPSFPQLSATTSFPYIPERVGEIKPDTLSDVTLYHNRGNGTWQRGSEDFTFGDFYTLDDLMTENPKVVSAMTDIYSTWANFGIDGFRIDTAKHVNFPFWQEWTKNIKAAANNKDFFMFGEVYNFDARDLAPYARNTEMDATLDFGWQSSALAYLRGGSAEAFGGIYAADDLYTTPHSTAGDMPTFLGNHDMGRIGYLLNGKSNILERELLGHELMFLTRGQPVVYYGDEQGFVGTGNDKDARQSLFASQVSDYQNQLLVDGTTLGNQDHFSQTAPVYAKIQEVARLRNAHDALKTGAQIQLYADNGPGIYAFARVDRNEKTEYLVAVNNTEAPKSASFPTLTANTEYVPLYGATDPVKATDKIDITVPAFGAVVYKANKPVNSSDNIEITLAPNQFRSAEAQSRGLDGQPTVTSALAEVSATIAPHRWAETSFAWRIVGETQWKPLGVATGDKPRVFHDVDGLDRGTLVEYRAVSVDSMGNKVATSSYASVNLEQGELGTQKLDPLQAHVFVPGTHNDIMGCTKNWQENCPQAELKLDPASGWYTQKFTLPAGNYQYKVALNGTWDESYGEKNGVRGIASGAGGENSPYHLDSEQEVTFFYNPDTHEFYNTAQRDSWTLPGTFNKDLGCTTGGVNGGNWDPACLVTLMADPENDGVFIFETLNIPAGDHEVKAAKNFRWNNGEIGCPSEAGGNCHFTAQENKMTRFTLDVNKHTLSITSVDPTRYIEYQTHWLAPDTFAWPTELGHDGTWELYWAADGGITIDDGIKGAEGHVALVKDPRGLASDLKKNDPHLRDYTALHPAQDIDNIEDILTGQLMVVYTNPRGVPLYAGGVQTPRVLDALYADSAGKREQGVSFDGDTPSLSLWAPTAKSVTLRLFEEPGADGVVGNNFFEYKMNRETDGSWTILGKPEWKNRPYQYDVEVYIPEIATVSSQPDQKKKAETIQNNIVTDPNSVALAVNSTHSVIVDLSDKEFIPAGWPGQAPQLKNFTQHAIYELNVRDFSIADQTVPQNKRGTYAAFTEQESDGMKHLKELSAAGMNTIHLLPTNDIGSIPELRADQETPNVPQAGSDHAEQQEAVMAVADRDGFNWGYDPYHYVAPEGSYAMDENQYGGKRTREYRQMVAGLHEAGYQVILDQVFNHTYSSAQYQQSTFDRIVPGYYYRLDMKGTTLNTPCCSEVATEHKMAEDHMVDSIVSWAKIYKVDGFRFDLMGFHSRDTMEKVRAELDALTVEKDGIDGKKMYLYGEGWNFGSVANDVRFKQARQGNLDGTGIGSFNDRLRDGVHGHGDNKFEQGFGNGLATAPNAHTTSDNAAYEKLKHKTDLIRLGLAGNLRDYEFYTSDGNLTRGDHIDYGGQPAGFASQPYESVNYVDAHDNETLYDLNVFGLPIDTSMDDRVRMNTLSLATVAMGQSPMFWHGGTDILRSKSLDRNSYNSGDYFNQIDWSLQTNNFGIGLPPARDNQQQWGNMAPLLQNGSLKPDQAAMKSASAQAQELLKLRSSSPLFTLGSAELIKERVTFPDAGSLATPGMIMMRISDPRPQTTSASTAMVRAFLEAVMPVSVPNADDLDPDIADILVVFNATPQLLEKSIEELKGIDYALSDIQANGVDEVVKSTTWSKDEGKVSIPARSVAVLVAKQETPDTVRPVITVDPQEVALTVGAEVPVLTDGVSATDDVDGVFALSDIVVKVEKVDGDSVTVVDKISTDIPGTFQVTYSVVDKAGNTAAPVVRTYSVVDLSAPVVIVEPASVELAVGSQVPVLTDGVSATDDVDGVFALSDIVVKVEKVDGDSVTVVDKISTDIPGTFQVTYSVVDKAGNTAAPVTRTYSVTDQTPPEITVQPAEISLTVGDVMPTEEQLRGGASATDNVDSELSITLEVPKEATTDKPGMFIIRFTVSDSAGNTASAERTYHVVAAPVQPEPEPEGPQDSDLTNNQHKPSGSPEENSAIVGNQQEPDQPQPSSPTVVDSPEQLSRTGVDLYALGIIALVVLGAGMTLRRRYRQ
ncbi:pullulanase-type alpha-1,6-glucosidase [Arcanobacterium phocisimile]|uniref:Pullulanase-type alpha-1,6-glucosidase n=1 Tax=Arcanobacterium phocisimile TaxID=1302235 RepID=A0ABX7IEU6_9ACTO|nr:pullulanase-type alpha-1,6-glucosidase [Arcanobacterium phocisimile]QRV01486.1 pullulanase-type alpha-1,6-glucosidase [Arcanobacterium phocisimile]